MTDSTQENADIEVKSKYDELPDAPPKKELKLTWVGKLGVTIVVFWLVIAFIGPYIAPFHEADIIGDDSPAADAELIALTIDVMRELGFNNEQFVIRLSKACGKNLTPFWQTWNLPLTGKVAAETADLPKWENHPVKNYAKP